MPATEPARSDIAMTAAIGDPAALRAIAHQLRDQSSGFLESLARTALILELPNNASAFADRCRDAGESVRQRALTIAERLMAQADDLERAAASAEDTLRQLGASSEGRAL